MSQQLMHIFNDAFDRQKIPLPSSRHNRSNGGCLEDKRENHVCSVQYCVQQLCTVQRTHIRTDLTVLWIGFVSLGPFHCAYIHFYSAPLCKRCTSYGNSVCLSVRPSVRPSVCPSATHRYCVKTTARSTVQFAPSDSKMCLVL